MPADARFVARSVAGAGVFFLAVLGGCAHREPPVAPDAALHPRSVAIIPVLPSEYLTLDRRSAVGGVIERLDRWQKHTEFMAQYDGERAVVADALTAALLVAAKRRGFEAVVLKDIARNREDPEDFVYPEIESDADVVVHVHLRDVGVFNALLSLDYEPNVDVGVELVARRSGFVIVDERFHYGAFASRQAFWAVPSDPGDRWPDFGAVMAQRREVTRSWAKGAEALATRIVEQLPAPTIR